MDKEKADILNDSDNQDESEMKHKVADSEEIIESQDTEKSSDSIEETIIEPVGKYNYAWKEKNDIW